MKLLIFDPTTVHYDERKLFNPFRLSEKDPLFFIVNQLRIHKPQIGERSWTHIKIDIALETARRLHAEEEMKQRREEQNKIKIITPPKRKNNHKASPTEQSTATDEMKMLYKVCEEPTKEDDDDTMRPDTEPPCVAEISATTVDKKAPQRRKPEETLISDISTKAYCSRPYFEETSYDAASLEKKSQHGKVSKGTTHKTERPIVIEEHTSDEEK